MCLAMSDELNTPATKADLEQLRSDLRSEMKELGERLSSESQHAFDDLKETFRDGQTELLKAFYSYAQSTDLKLKDAQTSDIFLRERLDVLESRITDVEKRLKIPPAA